MNPPRGVLLDLGNTLLRELGFDPEAGTRRLLALAKHNPRDVSAEQLRTHAERIVEAMQGPRFESQIEFPASATTRLIYDSAGIELACEDPDLEFWRASMRMEPEPHVATVLDDLARRRLPLGVVSNSAFAGNVLCDELERHGLLDRFRFVMASCDYGFRKPHPLLFEAAAARRISGWDKAAKPACVAASISSSSAPTIRPWASAIASTPGSPASRSTNARTA